MKILYLLVLFFLISYASAAGSIQTSDPAKLNIIGGTVSGNLSTVAGISAGANLVAVQHNPTLINSVEESLIMDGTQMDCWYRSLPDFKIRYAYSTDSYNTNWQGKYEMSSFADGYSYSYPYVVKNGSTYYMLIKRSTDLCLYQSTNKINWTIMNNGNPVLTHSASTSSPLYQIFNPAFYIANDGTWHLLIECAASTGGFRTEYSYSTLAAGPNFNTHITTTPVFTGETGNPFLTYIPERSAFLAIYGDYNGEKWVIRSSSALASSNLSLPASWVVNSGFGIQTDGIHCADPTVVWTTRADKPWKMRLDYGYAQIDDYSLFGQVNATQFYDAIKYPTTRAFGRINTTGLVKASGFIIGQWDTARISSIGSDGMVFYTGSLADPTLTKRMQIDVDGAVRFDGGYPQIYRGGGGVYDYSFRVLSTDSYNMQISTARAARYLEIGYHDLSSVFHPFFYCDPYTGKAGVGGAPPANATFAVTSTTGGFLPPRMTTTQMAAIGSPTEGLTAYNTTTHQLCVFTTTWRPLAFA